jgi:hypothetical protein
LPFHLPPAVPCAQRSNRFDDSRLPRSDVYIYLTDSYRGFPYQRAQGQAGIDDYRAKLTTQVEQVLAAGQSGHVVYVPFNEPEGNMYGAGQYSYNNVSWLSDPRYFFAEWKQVHDLIKGLDPHARIAGPNSSVLYDQVKGFLRYCKVNDCLPDVVTWHELSSPGSVRSKVDADLAYWNIDGNLNDSVAEANKGNGQWWLFNAYGQLTGDTVRVTPPSPGQQYTLQGIATLDRAKRQSRAIFGGASGAAVTSCSTASAPGRRRSPHPPGSKPKPVSSPVRPSGATSSPSPPEKSSPPWATARRTP